MSRISLENALPRPKYTGEDEEPVQAPTRGPRIVGAGALDESQIVLKVCDAFYFLLFAGMTDVLSSEQDHHHTATEQDGDHDQQRILAMAVPFQKFLMHSIHSTWAERRQPVQMH